MNAEPERITKSEPFVRAAGQRQRKCLLLSAGEAIAINADPPAFATRLPPGQFRFETLVTGGAGWVRIALTIFLTVLTRRPAVVISGEYRRSFLGNLALIATWNRAPHLVIGMNLSAKPIVSRYGLVQRLIDAVFRRTTAIIVHSTREAENFADLHHLPAERFAFSHRGFDLPTVGTDRFDTVQKPYFCMIGRNNRDLECFAQAVAIAGTRGIAVIPGYLAVRSGLDQELELHRDLSLADCISCMRNAAGNVTLLRDGSRGAGHITVVTAMHLGRPQIFSDTEVLQEYFPDDRFGLAVPVGDPVAAAAAMKQVLAEASTPEAAERRAVRQDFAGEWLSHDRATRRIAAVLTDMVDGRRVQFLDPEWQFSDRGPVDVPA